MRRTSPEISPVMRGLAQYISSALRKPLSGPVLEKTKHHVLDTIAAMVSGSRLLPGRKAIAYIKTRGGTHEACVVGSRIVTTVENAALANGMLAHADETDDSHAATSQHPGCAIVPAALAMAECKQRNGMAMLRATALGYDMSIRMNSALQASGFRVVGHSTHSFGPAFGAAAAAGALAGLSYDQVRHLLSYTAQQVSGVGCFQRDIEHVDKVVVRVYAGGANVTDNREMSDICMQHMCALMLTDGYVTFESAHDNKRMTGRKVLAMRRRIELIADEELEKLRPEKHAIVEIVLTDGRRLRHHTRAVRGTAQNPMTRAEVNEKCFSLIMPIIGKKRSRALCDAIWGVEKLSNIRALRQLLTT